MPGGGRHPTRQAHNCPKMPREAILESPGRHKIPEKSVTGLVHVINCSLGTGGEGEGVLSKGRHDSRSKETEWKGGRHKVSELRQR